MHVCRELQITETTTIRSRPGLAGGLGWARPDGCIDTPGVSAGPSSPLVCLSPQAFYPPGRWLGFLRRLVVSGSRSMQAKAARPQDAVALELIHHHLHHSLWVRASHKANQVSGVETATLLLDGGSCKMLSLWFSV